MNSLQVSLRVALPVACVGAVCTDPTYRGKGLATKAFLDAMEMMRRDGRVLLGAVDAPPTEWESPLGAFEAAYAHEQKVTGMINELVKLATDEGDNAAGGLLQWFVAEQVEEESSADEVVQKLKLIKDSPGGLVTLDAELAQRKAD